MDFGLRRDLIDALIQVPATGTYEGRTALLGGLAQHISLNRSSAGQRTDLELIVDQLFGCFLSTDEWALLVLFQQTNLDF